MSRQTVFTVQSNRGFLLGLLLCWLVAYASPLVKPIQFEVVCSRGGPNLLLLNRAALADGQTRNLQSTLDCPDCLPIALPAAPITVRARLVPAAVLALLPPPFLFAVYSDLPPPPRGPPSL